MSQVATLSFPLPHQLTPKNFCRRASRNAYDNNVRTLQCWFNVWFTSGIEWDEQSIELEERMTKLVEQRLIGAGIPIPEWQDDDETPMRKMQRHLSPKQACEVWRELMQLQ